MPHIKLQLRKLLLSDEQLLAAIHLNEDQQEFSGGHAWEILARLRSSPYPDAVHPHIVTRDDNIVGFFVLREAPALPVWAMPNVMTLHNFRIGSQFQRQGLGAATVRNAAQWVAENRQSVSQLMLSVNAGNQPGAALFQSCGFRLTGTSFEGRIGPERIMAGDLFKILTYGDREG